jgi:hypothetical protein
MLDSYLVILARNVLILTVNEIITRTLILNAFNITGRLFKIDNIVMTFLFARRVR